MEAALKRLMQDDIIEPAAGSTVRICVDYRGLNEVTSLRRHYIPTFEGLLDKAGSSRVLTTLDLASGCTRSW